MARIVVSTSSFDLKANPAIARLSDAAFTITTNPFNRRLTEAEVCSLLAPDVVGMIAGVEPLTAAVFERAPGLRVLSRCGTGLDNVDLEAARARGIDVRNTPDAPAQSVAELTVGLMLAVLRRIPRADRTIRAGSWGVPGGSLLKTRTVGLIGFGRVARRVARIVRAFDARVVAYDPFVAGTEGDDVEMLPLDRLLETAGVISLHCPATPHTRGLIDRAALARIRPGTVLINTARGDLVDEEALLHALESGHLGGAGLDVFLREPYQGPLSARDDVVLTSHMGSAARETRLAMEQEAAGNLVDGLERAGLLELRNG